MADTSSPASSGPAGSHFEGQIGAHYLLSLLVQTEARGLPGALMERVEFQRAPEGRPLDDVIVTARDAKGKEAILEIQVKRSISFAPKDEIFRSVVGQMVKATKGDSFWATRHELAVATAKSSAKIDRAYQEVINQARQIGDAKTFTERINREGSVNEDMRTFVDTFKRHLAHFGSATDDDFVWRLLDRFQILVFDFAATGSQSEELAKERCLRALHRDHADRSGGLWSTLVELALDISADGGDRNLSALVKDLERKHFSLPPQSTASTVRAVLAEAASDALADIGGQVGGVSLPRYAYTAAVHAALRENSYVEIRGDSGVGKSDILKQVAAEVSVESPIIVLTPNRTIEKGWTAFRSVLGFDGDAKELLSDLASDGGAYLFIDNLDFFEPGERATVKDLVRAAAEVPGFSVIVTSRRSLEEEKSQWLQTDTHSCASPIEIGELSDSEIDALRGLAPELSVLLSERSPARDVARNLFRLDRLIEQRTHDTTPYTETQLLTAWWQDTNNVLPGTSRHECARIMRALAAEALAGRGSIETESFRADAVDALISSGTLKELDLGRVAFQHDVFREWALASQLSSSDTALDELPLSRPASPALARGVELAARMALEREPDDGAWSALLERLGQKSAHGSWRRNVLIGLVHAENASELLDRVKNTLLGDGATLLGELIRIVLAVDSVSALELFEASGIPREQIPRGIRVPEGSSWLRLVAWLLRHSRDLPKAALPAVVDLYTEWSTAHLGQDPLTPTLNQWLVHWLSEIERRRETGPYVAHRDTEDIGLSTDQTWALETSLRHGFLLFSHRSPELAANYLQSLAKRRSRDEAVITVLKLSGNIAQAAPKELAKLTARVLTESERDDEDTDRRYRPFEFVDYVFHPASPTQGPFLGLLTHSPEHGLWLVRKLVDHAIEYYTGGRDCGDNKLVISFEHEDRTFSWRESYAWSRQSAGHNCLTSALMAMEEWGHRRVEAGDDIEMVIDDVMAAVEMPAAGLLFIVDLLLSHWPISREASLRYLACPELLCIDRERLALESMNAAEFFGASNDHAGAARASLQKRPSRKHSLDELLSHLGGFGPSETREKLKHKLELASARLGEPSKDATLRDPALMAVHALNRVNPDNYRDVEMAKAGMTPRMAKEYVPPESEVRHMAPLQAEQQSKNVDHNVQYGLSAILTDESRSTPEFVESAIEWAKRTATTKPDTDSDAAWIREQAIFCAAMVAMRDGTAEVRSDNLKWADSVFAEALKVEEDGVHRVRDGIRYNPFAIAFAGMVYALQVDASKDRIRALLLVAGDENPAAAHGLLPALKTLNDIDNRVPLSLLRVALVASVKPRRVWNRPDDETQVLSERYRKKVKAAIERETRWLFDNGQEQEPPWPDFPEEPVRARRRLRIPGGPQADTVPNPKSDPPDQHVDYQAASLWLRALEQGDFIERHTWVDQIVRRYAGPTALANGATLDRHAEVDRAPAEWNRAYYGVFARCLHRLSWLEVDELMNATVIDLPDESFFDAVADFLRSVDAVYFKEPGLDDEIAVRARRVIANRLQECRGWKHLARSNSASVEIHIAPAIATIFFGNHLSGQRPSCYLYEKGIDDVAPFLPILETLILDCPSQFVAMTTLSLLEVSPRESLLPLFVSAVTCWLNAHEQDVDYWMQYGIGERVCSWLRKLNDTTPLTVGSAQSMRADIERILSAMVRFGLSDARQLERLFEGEAE